MSKKTEENDDLQEIDDLIKQGKEEKKLKDLGKTLPDDLPDIVWTTNPGPGIKYFKTKPYTTPDDEPIDTVNPTIITGTTTAGAGPFVPSSGSVQVPDVSTTSTRVGGPYATFTHEGVEYNLNPLQKAVMEKMKKKKDGK